MQNKTAKIWTLTFAYQREMQAMNLFIFVIEIVCEAFFNSYSRNLTAYNINLVLSIHGLAHRYCLLNI